MSTERHPLYQGREEQAANGHLVFVDWFFFILQKNMRLTNGQFVKQLLEHDAIANDVVHYLMMSEKLIKKYGKLLFVAEILEEIKKESEDLYNFLLLLKTSKKTSIKDIKVIVSLLKKQSKSYQEEFVIKSASEVKHTAIAKYLKESFKDAVVEYKELKGEEISVAGEGRYYKRSLEQDVKKMLGI